MELEASMQNRMTSLFCGIFKSSSRSESESSIVFQLSYGDIVEGRQIQIQKTRPGLRVRKLLTRDGSSSNPPGPS